MRKINDAEINKISLQSAGGRFNIYIVDDIFMGGDEVLEIYLMNRDKITGFPLFDNPIPVIWIHWDHLHTVHAYLCFEKITPISCLKQFWSFLHDKIKWSFGQNSPCKRVEDRQLFLVFHGRHVSQVKDQALLSAFLNHCWIPRILFRLVFGLQLISCTSWWFFNFKIIKKRASYH